MRRKLIWQGNNSATLTLPINWVREKGLKEGAEIDVIRSGEHLMIGANERQKKKKISVEFKKNVKGAVKKLLASLYRNGYDEILINHNYHEIEKYAHKMVWTQLVGFEMIKKGEKQFLLKDIADLNPESFPVLFKKSFLLLLNFSEEIAHYLRKQDVAGLAEVISLDREINKTTNLCIRMLNKKMNDKNKIFAYTYMLRSMELLGDIFKDLAKSYIRKKKFPTQSALEILDDVVLKLRKIYSLYYNFDLEETLLLNDELRKLAKKLDEVSSRGNIYRFFHSILSKMETLTGGPLALNIEGQHEVKKDNWALL